MTPAVRFFWIVSILWLPLSFYWLVSATQWEITPIALADQPRALISFLLAAIFVAIGLHDLYFSESNLRRNYPVFANLRYLFESIRPEIRQYFIASNLEEAPFNREARDLIYRRAKNLNDTIPFGTENDLMSEGYLTVFHSIKATVVPEHKTRVLFGGPQCRKPYSASLLNISGMSFGALSANAISALNKAAAIGQFAHNTGEGSISDYHRTWGGDLIWQIGTGYFGCRNLDGSFNDQAFAKNALSEAVKMIEIKISQGAKPSHGGVLPGAKVTAEIARIRLVEVGKTVASPANHPEFDTPGGLLDFVQRLRELSGGKPTGFKLCIGRKSEFMSIVKAMLVSGIYPDFITVDGAEGGTGAAPVEFSNRLGLPCLEATYFVHQVLVGAGLRDNIRIISAGKTASGFDMLSKMAVGADTVNAARSMMLALGCVQSKSCNTNKCPTGIATTDPVRGKAIDIEDKSKRVANYHHGTVEAFLEMCGALGYDDPDMLKPCDLFQRVGKDLKHFDQIYSPLSTGQLLTSSVPDAYVEDWHKASADQF
ncbi:MAG: FMN-binding glutamate synthase family protein [Gammaproteobacteria bacterium]|nr:FMN-binding glutamate synthase family protein [Gammaproteobacteria bacterium]MDP2142017.1 FMN-binding glutamate synthase family protein [Gammaproteobacteria bacterium]MDP2348404.1 FMN-binding glutamate synthase family protein [Gammaproteobacteria bacterium]